MEVHSRLGMYGREEGGVGCDVEVLDYETTVT